MVTVNGAAVQALAPRGIDAGQAVEIGPYNASRTARAFRSSGTITSTRSASSRAGIVTVTA